ncbi:hypothetical protein LTR85_008694 [Meristemomyces frigidus]|nr:hypothetical protein LTR85_008694 [Meristemomyces frigidus]
MAEVLGVVASIVSVLQLSKGVVDYLKSVHDAPRERRDLVVLLTQMRALLYTLKDLVQSVADDDWSSTLRSLSGADSPLTMFNTGLEDIARILSMPVGTAGGAYAAIGKFKWPFEERRLKKLFASLERLKTHFQLAVENDHLRLSRLIRQDVERVGEGIRALKHSVHAVGSAVQATELGITRVATDVAALHDNVHDVKCHQLTAEQRDALRRSHTFDYSRKRFAALELQAEGTLGWFLYHPDFRCWRSADEFQFLICEGGPGVGKTVASACAFQHLQEIHGRDPGTGLSCVFLDYCEIGLHSVQLMLRSIIAQTLKLRPLLWNVCDIILRQDEFTVSELLSILRAMRHQLPRWFIVLDALDECHEDVLDDIIGHLSSSGVGIKIMATTRTVSIVRGLKDRSRVLAVRAADSDVEMYVTKRLNIETRLRNFVGGDRELAESIRQAILAKCQGM